MDDRSRPGAFIALPPWLGFWVVVYLISLPATIRALWFSLSSDALPGEVWIPFSRFLRLADVAEWVPALLLFLGVISLGLPGLRGLWVRKAYGLRDSPDLPVIGEIREFLSIHAPGLGIKANLLRTDLLAFVMPLGYRARAIALFGGLVVLWRRDREAAQAVLLHESGHARQGDVFAVGMGSAFKALLDVWLPLTLGAVVLPMVLVWGMDAGRFVILGDLSPREGVTHKVVQLAVVYLPGLGLTMGGLFVESLGTILLPLAGLWSAEFYADHRAVVMQGTPGPLLRNLEASERGGRMLRSMTHPPPWLRRWMAAGTRSPFGQALLLLLFPLAYPLKGAALLTRAWSAYRMLGVPRTVIWDTLRSHAANYVQTITPVWIGMILLLLVWPLVVDRNSSGVRAWLPYGVAALVLTGMGVGLRCVFQ